MTPIQEFIEVLKIHRDTAFEKEKMCGAEARSYYEGRAVAFNDAISFAELQLEKEEEAKKNLKDEVLRIITEHDFDLGKASLRKKIMNL